MVMSLVLVLDVGNAISFTVVTTHWDLEMRNENISQPTHLRYSWEYRSTTKSTY